MPNDVTRLFKLPKENIIEVANIETNQIWWHKIKHTKRTTTTNIDKYTMMASGSDDKTIKIWDLPTGICLATLSSHRGSVTCLALMNNCMIVSGSTDSTLKIWDMKMLETMTTSKTLSQCVRTLRGHGDFVTSVIVFPTCVNGAHLASSSIDKTIRLWDAVTGKCVRVLYDHLSGVSCLVLTPSSLSQSELIVSGSWDRTLKVGHLFLNKNLIIDFLINHFGAFKKIVKKIWEI